MSQRTDRPGSREGRRGLQSVVQLYLSRPPRKPIEWPDAGAAIDPREEPAPSLDHQDPYRRETEPAFSAESAELSHADVDRAVDTSFEATFGRERSKAREDDAAMDLRERLDARLDAVSAIPLDDVDVEEWGTEEASREADGAAQGASLEGRDGSEGVAASGESAATVPGPAYEEPAEHAGLRDAYVEEVTLELIEDELPEETDGFEAAPEPVLSGISLDVEDRDDVAPETDAYGAFGEMLPEAAFDPDETEFGSIPGDMFSEEALPPQEIGSEALRAELAFKLEEHLDTTREPTEASIDVAIDNPRETSIEEIFDLVDRSLALGPGAGIVPAMPPPVPEAVAPEAAAQEVAAPEVVEWELLPEVEADAYEPELAPSDSAVAPAAPAIEPAPASSFAPAMVPTPGPDLEAPDTNLHEALEAPHVALFLSTLPPRLRRRLLDTLAAPLVGAGRRVLFLEPDPSDDDTGGLIEEVLGLDTAVWRRSLGASPREILLMRPAQREELFGALAAEERRSELVLLGVGLPESIVTPRMLPLIDTVVVGLTRQESSLYEAYRALRGLPERRPGFSPYAVTIASSVEEAALLLERFRQIAQDFLRMPVLDGGWLELAAMPHTLPDAGRALADARTGGRPRDPSLPGIDAALLNRLSRGGGDARDAEDAQGARTAARPGASHDGRPERAFFERLGDWFGLTSRP